MSSTEPAACDSAGPQADQLRRAHTRNPRTQRELLAAQVARKAQGALERVAAYGGRGERGPGALPAQREGHAKVVPARRGGGEEPGLHRAPEPDLPAAVATAA